MPKLILSKDEAAALKRRRARNKAWNTAIQAAADSVRKRLKACQDPLQAATLNEVLGDIRRMLRT
jgi:hypothetical protein